MVKIANTVYAKEVIELQDGTEVALMPLVISRLKRFMARWDDIKSSKDEDESLAIFIDCCGIALEKDYASSFEHLKGTGKKTLSDEYRVYLEDTLDMDSIYKIIEVCAGIKLNDPKLLEEAIEALTAAEAVEDGTT